MLTFDNKFAGHINTACERYRLQDGYSMWLWTLDTHIHLYEPVLRTVVWGKV